MMNRKFVGLIVFTSMCGTTLWAGPPDAPSTPDTYPVDYAPATEFCPPIRSTFFEVEQSYMVVRGKRFRQKKNGGYGLRVVDKVGDQNLRHVGADLGWYQIGEPVFAVATGVVRLSTGPKYEASSDNGKTSRSKRPTNPSPTQLAWGNVVAIEHRLPDGKYVTTIYGHLDSNRLVKAGDVVEAGQPLGVIGRQHIQINGNYRPHLHFGVRKGRLINEGQLMMRLNLNGQPAKLTIKSMGAKEVELESDVNLPNQFATIGLNLNGNQFFVKVRDGKLTLPAKALWHCPAIITEVIGYDLKTDLWHDPIAFLKEHQAHTQPAKLQFPVGKALDR